MSCWLSFGGSCSSALDTEWFRWGWVFFPFGKFGDELEGYDWSVPSQCCWERGGLKINACQQYELDGKGDVERPGRERGIAGINFEKNIKRWSHGLGGGGYMVLRSGGVCAQLFLVRCYLGFCRVAAPVLQLMIEQNKPRR